MTHETLSSSHCRICYIANDNDFVNLFENNDELDKTLTIAGRLYEELVGAKIHPSEPAHFPKTICQNCYLQTKLLKGLKERAFKSLAKLASHLNKKNDGTQHHTEMLTVTDIQQSCSKRDSIFPMENITKNSIDNGFKSKESLIEVNSDCIEVIENGNITEDIDNTLIVYDSLADAVDTDEDLISTTKADHEGVHITNKLATEHENSTKCTILQYFETKNERNCQCIQKTVNETDIIIEKNLCKCMECDIQFATLRKLREHREDKHPYFHQCPKCSKVFRSGESFEAHLKLHLGLPAYSCEQCNKTFKQKAHYHYHIKRHNNERNFVCKECGKKYVSKSDLSTHMRKHSRLRPYTCSIENCGKTFYTEQHLKMHMFYHSGTKSFECEICYRKFVSPSVLRTHVKTIHDEQHFECSLCGKKFRRKHHLKIHALTHRENTSDPMVFENFDNLLGYDDGVHKITEKNQATNELNYVQFIDVKGLIEEAYSDEEL